MRWICFLFCIALFADQDPTHLAVMEGFPSFLIDGCVSAITGDYYYSCDDIVVRGAEPIRIPHSYLSSRALEGRGGWSDLEHLYGWMGPEFFLTTETNGARLRYEKRAKNGKHHLDYISLGRITNCARGDISARHDLENQYLVLNNSHDHFRVYAADGTVRIYKKTHEDSEFARTFFYLQREELPNGHLVHYSYNSKNVLTEIKTTNADKSKTFAWIRFEWPARDDNSQNHKITTSDGQNFDMLYKRLKHYDNELYKYHKNQEISLLRRATSWNKPQEQYEYYLAKNACNPRLRTIHLPEGRSRSVHYHEPNKSKVDKQLHGTVKALLDGKQEKRYTFAYRPGASRYDNAYFDVFDAAGNKTIYGSQNHRPLFIKRFDDKKLISSEHYAFDGHRLATVTKYDAGNHLIHKRKYTYDKAGNVIREDFIHDGVTSTTTRTFTSNHLLKSETNPAGLKTCYTYLASTDLIKQKTHSDADGIFLTERYTYDADNLLIAKTLDDGITCKTTRYERLQTGFFIGMPSAIIESYTEGGQEKQLIRKELEYNAHGQVTKQRIYDADGIHRYTLATKYDSHGRPVKESDALGQITNYTYDQFDNVTSVKKPSGASLEMSYDYRNRLIKKIENDERTTSYTYNVRGDLTKSCDYRGAITTYIYDGLSRLIQTTEPQNRITKVIYDANDNPISQTTPAGHTTHTQYNALNLPILVTYPDGTTQKKNYDQAGRLLSETNPSNITTTYTVDTLGRTTTKKTPLTFETWTYSAFDITTYTDPENNLTRYTYDGAGRKIAENLAGETTLFAYDSLGRQHKTTIDNSVWITGYDLLDRPIEERSEDTNNTLFTKIAYTYDASGNKTSIIKHCGTEHFTYDLYSRQTSHTNALGHTTQTHYPDHFTTITTDPLKRSTKETRDVYDRIITLQRLNPQAAEIGREDFTYDLDHNKLSQTSTIYRDDLARTSTIRWEYDSMGRVTTLIEAADTPLERTTKTTYTLTGQIHTLTKPSGICLTSTYDALDRLTSLSSSDGSIDYRYTYNGLSQLTYVIDPVTKTSSKRKWDPKGRLLFEGLANGFTLTSTYDPAGRRLTLKLPSGTASYIYDAHFMRKVSFDDQTHRYLSYDLDGHLLSEKLCNHSGTVKYTYDALGRRISLKHPHITHTFDAFDPVGNLLKSNHSTYAYDDHNHLTQENTSTYTYDSHHNREPVNALNQLQDITYDKDGHPIQNGDTHYSYDALGRLISITQNNQTTTYTYDFLHRRQTSSNGTRYLWDDKNEIGTDNQLRILGQGLGAEIGASILLQIDGYTYTPLHDLHGNLSTLFYNSNKPYQSYTFDAFSHTSTSTWIANPYSPWRYASKRHDPSGLIYFGRRYYDPTRGRFLTPDPTGFTDSPNLYQYVLGNPLTNHDLYGEFTLEDISKGLGHTAWFIGTHGPMPESTGVKWRRWGAKKANANLPVEFDQPKIISLFEGKEHPLYQFISGNGIMNDSNDALEMLYAHFYANGGYNVHHLYNPSKGFSRDITRVIKEKLGIETPPVKLAKEFLNQTIEQGKIPFSTWHSEGGLIGKRAHELSGYSEFLQENARAFTLGSAGVIPRSLVHKSMNFISNWDPVPGIAHLTHPRYHKESNVTMLKPLDNFFFTDHAFKSFTYSDTLKSIYEKVNEN